MSASSTHWYDFVVKWWISAIASCAPVGLNWWRPTREVGLEDWFQDQFQRGLHCPVGDDRNAQRPQFLAGLGDHHPPHRRRGEGPEPQLIPNLTQKRLHPVPGHDPGHGGPIGSGGAHPCCPRRVPTPWPTPSGRTPGCTDHRTGERHRRPPSSAACSASSVPPRKPRRRSATVAPVFTDASSDITVTFCSFRCRPSPCGRLSRPRSTTTTPPHRHLRPATRLSPRGGTVRRWFPRSLLFGRRARRPALPLRSRRGYAAGLHHDLPGPTHLPSRQFPAPGHRLDDGSRPGCAPHSRPNPPGSSGSTIKRLYDTGSSRAPSRLAHQARPVR